MMRSQIDRLTEMVAKQTRMNQTLEEHGMRLAEIAASLAALTKALIPPVTTETSLDTVGSTTISAHSSDRQSCNVTSSLAAITEALALPAVEEHATAVASLDAAAATSSFGIRRCSTILTMLPSFNGEELISWVDRDEQHFELNCTPPGKKVSAVVVAMEGPALYWLTWLRAQKPVMSWDELTQALVTRFDSRFKGNCFKRLPGGKQTGTVEEYISIFPKDIGQPPGTNVSRFPDFNLEDTVILKEDGLIENGQSMGRDRAWAYFCGSG
ncbi:unnamed protein product [Cuscuta europaea]|uniref:Retrotransposon gag domain-containing protein n=1 Tax=Cuscuta europaea TaxID=41803 RepID=A0A9P0ZA56_CUSEU|nr:unnamed protein product [Cuscuta europaea]